MAIKSKKLNEDILFVKELIPENGRKNFERNVETLKINVYEDKKRCTGEYSPKENYINLSLKGLSNMAYRNNYDYFDYLNYSVKYLLLNVAITNYDKDNDIIYSGFSTYNFNKIKNEDINENLNRGFMSLLLSDESIENIISNNVYYPIAGMLTEIVGMDIMKDAFFNNKGLTPIIDKLNWCGVSRDDAKELFKDINNIEKGYEEKTIYYRLPRVQKTLVSFFSKKIDKTDSKETLIKEKNNFNYFLNYSLKNGRILIKDLYEDESSYERETEQVKELSRTM